MKTASTEETVVHLDSVLVVHGQDELPKHAATIAATATAPAIEDSSIDDASSCSIWNECDDASTILSTYSKSSTHNRIGRRVSFSTIETREYNITVGDHPLCRDGLPLQLDWDHSEEVVINIKDALLLQAGDEDDNGTTTSDASIGSTTTRSSSTSILAQREDKYHMPRRLSYEEKRERLISLANYTDQRDRNQKLGQVIQGMQSWWKEHPMLPMPDLSSIQEETTYSIYEEEEETDRDEQDFVEIEPPNLEEYVFYWRRNPIQAQKTATR
jgi:hypothetical protein